MDSRGLRLYSTPEIFAVVSPAGGGGDNKNKKSSANLNDLQYMKEIADEVEPHYYISRKDGRHIRLFDRVDLEKYFSEFDKVEIVERKTTRYGNVKNYLIFIGKI